jgi:hypothetical protein
VADVDLQAGMNRLSGRSQIQSSKPFAWTADPTPSPPPQIAGIKPLDSIR